MKRYLFLFFVCISFSCFAQNISVCSWNLKNFGKSKSDAELEFIAKVLNSFDVIAIQEVVAGYGGPQAVARLSDELNRQGAKWDYTISNVTSGTGKSAERYAFIWKTKKLQKVGDAWLEDQYGLAIDREPYYCRFKLKNNTFTLVNFHAVPKVKQPETEIKYFKFLPDQYPDDHLIFCGDFNLPQSHTVFNPLKKMGYISALTGQKTSLKQKAVNGEYLASEYDNFYFHMAKINRIEAGILPFYESFEDLVAARLISDHVPIYLVFNFNETNTALVP